MHADGAKKDSEKFLARLQQGVELHQAGRLPEAEHLYRSVLASQPNQPDALYLLGVIAAQMKNPRAAADLIARALAIKPEIAGAALNYGLVLSELRQYEVAVASFDKAINLLPTSVEAHLNRGIALAALNRHEAALNSFDHAILLQPQNFHGHNNRGNALSALQRFEQAIESYDNAIRFKPDAGETYFNRGLAQRAIGERDLALQSFNTALTLNFNGAEIHYIRGLTWLELHQYEKAVSSFDNSLEIKPDHVKAHNDRGIALYYLRRHEAALSSFEQAINLKPDFIDAYNGQGLVLTALNDLQGALKCYDEAIRLNPESAEAYINRGNILKNLKRYQAAVNDYDKALSLKPDSYYLYGSWLHTRMLICDWRHFDSCLIDLTRKIEREEKAATPFAVLGLSDSPTLQRRAAEIWVADLHPPTSELGEISGRSRRDRIRVGYFSGDYHDHAVMTLMAELLECHNRQAFEIFALSYGPDSTSAMRQRVMSAVDRFIDVKGLSDREIAALSRTLEIDIAIDITGLTQASRLGIFALRAAPVQVNYLGYSGTMGAPYFDYIVADKVLIPKSARPYYCEKVVYLPSFQPNDGKRPTPSRRPSRREVGLPETGFVFCCFNNAYKITPEMFAAWARILHAVAGSVLWLSDNGPEATQNLRSEARRHGLDVERLIFAPRLPSLEDHLTRYRAADLFLDTRPYNAHTTASDALWSGLPVLTTPTEAFAGRVASSLLTALDFPELIAPSLEAYETFAIELALKPERLRDLKEKLARNRLAAPLFNTPLYAGHLEAAYTKMYQRYKVGLSPDHIEIES